MEKLEKNKRFSPKTAEKEYQQGHYTTLENVLLKQGFVLAGKRKK